MVNCAAVGCNVCSSGKAKTKNPSFFKFPLHEKGRLKSWEHWLGKKDWKPTKHSKVCKLHFEDDMIVEDIQERLTGIPLKKCKQLVPDAIPRKFRCDAFGHWHVGSPDAATVSRSSGGWEKSDAPTPSEQAADTHEQRPSTDKPRTHTVKRIHRMQQKQIVDELLRDKTSVPAKVPRKTAKTASSSVINVSETAAAPAQQDVVHADASRPTYEVPVMAATFWDQSTAMAYEMYPQTIYGHPAVVQKDHTYAPKPMSPPIPSASATLSTVPSEPPPAVDNLSSSPMQVEDFDDEDALDDMEDSHTQGDDPDYTPHSSEEESIDALSQDDITPDKDTTYLVYDSNLQHLMKRCQECGEAIIATDKWETGSLVTYKLSCHNGHDVIWRSQPIVKQTAIGNLMLAAAVLFTGLTYKRIATFAKAINLAILKKSAFDEIQKKKLFPVIKEAWEEQKAQLIKERENTSVTVSGDCRVDSPGHNGKYGTYTLMETSEQPNGPDKILNIQLVQCTEVKNSNGMEAEGLRRGLKEMINDDGLKVDTLVTDRHVQIRKILATEFGDVDHQFDVWHVSKGLVVKLNAKAALKKNAALIPWIQCVSNHLWWCCATCKGDEQDLRERWISILNHVTNKHRWSGCHTFNKCGHKRLTAAQRKKKAWLDPESSSFEALKEVVMDKFLLKSLPHLVKFHHTGALEVFHSQLLKYCSKRQHFGYRGMAARLMLAVLDWNTRECEPVLNKDGTHKMDQVFSKRRKQWVLRKRYQRSSGRQVEGLMARMLHVHRSGVELAPIVSPVLPYNISRTQKPDKEEAIAKYRTRFKEK